MKWPFIYVRNFVWTQCLQHLGCLMLFYAVILAPSLLLLTAVVAQSQQYRGYACEIEELTSHVARHHKWRQGREAFLKTYGEGAGESYMRQHVESLQFLQEEVSFLRSLTASSPFQGSEGLSRRLSFLTEGGNHLTFVPGERKRAHQIEEVELTQERAVEVNGVDLRQILVAIEGVQIGELSPPSGRPQLVIRQWLLSKHPSAEQETWMLNMQLMKREAVK